MVIYSDDRMQHQCLCPFDTLGIQNKILHLEEKNLNVYKQ